MRLTPLDIRKQEFHRAMRGLDSEEVYAFLSTVGDEYEALLNDNKALRERVLELDDKVQEYRTMEKTLRDTLITAERVTVEAKDNARREANLIIKEAQIEAEKALRDIKNESMKLHHEVRQLRQQRDNFLARMKVVAESHLKYIETAQREVTEDDDLTREGLSAAASAREKIRTEKDETSTKRVTETSSTREHRSDATDSRHGTGGANQGSESAAAGSTGQTGIDRRSREGEGVRAKETSARDTRQPVSPKTGYRQRGSNTLADINDILDRMADGSVEATRVPGHSDSTKETQSVDLFEPIPDPPVEVEEDRAGGPPTSREYPRRPTAPGPGTRIPTGRAWDYVTADNTGIRGEDEPSESGTDKKKEYDPLSALDNDRDRK